MEAKLGVLRALSQHFAVKTSTHAFLFFIIIMNSFLIVVNILALHFSPTWYLLLVFVYVPLMFIGILIFIFILVVAKKIYPNKLSKQQKSQLETFYEKIEKLIEVRGLSWWLFLLTCLKDLLIHRELRSLKNLVKDTTSLRHDLAQLETEFSR